MTTRRKLVLLALCLILSGITAFVAYGLYLRAYFSGYEQGSTDTLIAELYCDAAFLRAMKEGAEGPKIASLRNDLEVHVRTNWSSVQLNLAHRHGKTTLDPSLTKLLREVLGQGVEGQTARGG